MIKCSAGGEARRASIGGRQEGEIETKRTSEREAWR